jgi:hypothetical protein
MKIQRRISGSPNRLSIISTNPFGRKRRRGMKLHSNVPISIALPLYIRQKKFKRQVPFQLITTHQFHPITRGLNKAK